MSDQNPYEKLGVPEDASFDEIQDARNRQLEQHSGDAKRLEMIEASYDAILMDRLRMRQEGKIKVPERIRFPELRIQTSPKESPISGDRSPAWLQQMIDSPTSSDLLIPGIWYLGLSAVSIFFSAGGSGTLQLALVLGVGSSIYFLNRKEGRFGRAVLSTLLGLTVGLIVGGLIANLAISQLPLLKLSVEQFSSLVTFILLWLISSFLR
jgi:Protein CHAPERONE-LIKE PROTEIN OF POR1-like